MGNKDPFTHGDSKPPFARWQSNGGRVGFLSLLHSHSISLWILFSPESRVRSRAHWDLMGKIYSPREHERETDIEGGFCGRGKVEGIWTYMYKHVHIISIYLYINICIMYIYENKK